MYSFYILLIIESKLHTLLFIYGNKIIYFSRSTNQFTVYTAIDIVEGSWQPALVGNLPNPHGLTCEQIPTLGFKINQSGIYVKLTMDSTHGTTGTGLQYIDIIYTKACKGKL